MFKTKGGAGGQRLFEQCSKKLRIWRRLAPLNLSQHSLWITLEILCETVSAALARRDGWKRWTVEVCQCTCPLCICGLGR